MGDVIERGIRYNSLENPIGIETRRSRVWGPRTLARYNSLENPIGIETGNMDEECIAVGWLQLIRKPDRD